MAQKLLIMEEILTAPIGKWTELPMKFALSVDEADLDKLEQKLDKEFKDKGKTYKKEVKDKEVMGEETKPGILSRVWEKVKSIALKKVW